MIPTIQYVENAIIIHRFKSEKEGPVIGAQLDYYNLKDLIKELYLSKDKIREYLKQGDIFPNAFKLPSGSGGWQIPESDVIIFKQVNEGYQKKISQLDNNSVLPDSDYTTKQTADLLGIHSETLLKWLKKDNSLFKGAYKFNEEWRIPKTEVDNLVLKMSDSYSVSEVMENLEIARNTTLKWAKKKIFPNAFKFGVNWRIPKGDLAYVTDTRLSIELASELLNKSEYAVYKLINKGVFMHAEKTSNGWKIPQEDVDEYLKRESNFYRAEEVANKLELNIDTIRKWANQGVFPNAKKIPARGWKIPKSDIDDFLEERNDDTVLSVQEVADRLRYNKATINKWLKDENENVFPNAYKTTSGWVIPKDDLSSLEDRIKVQEVTIHINNREHIFKWNPKKLDELYTAINRVKKILNDRDLKDFSEQFTRDKKTIFNIVNNVFSDEFKDFIFSICKKVNENSFNNNGVYSDITAPRIYRILTEGSVKKGVESDDINYYRPLMPILKETIGQHHKESEQVLVNTIVQLDCEAFWKLSKSYKPLQLVKMALSNSDDFERFVRHCGENLKKRGKLVKVMSLISYCFFGIIESEKGVSFWKYCKDIKVFYDVVEDIYDYLINHHRDTYNYQNNKWDIIYKRVDAIENVTLDFSDFHYPVKVEVMEYIKSLLETNEDRKKIQQKLGGIKKVYEQLTLLPYENINSFLELNFSHVQHLITHFQNVKNNQGKPKYKLSTIKGFFTKARLLYDWLIDRDGSLEGAAVNPFRKYSFVNLDSYIENTEYIPEEVISQLEKHLDELPSNYRNAWLIMMNTGMRISDVLGLEEDCFEYDKGLKVYILSYIPQKVQKQRLKNGLSDYHEIPIDGSVVECIENQKDETKELRLLVTNQSYKKHIFLITNGYTITLPYSFDIGRKINEIVDKYDIRDENGNKFHYTNRMCRKTVTVELLSNGASIPEVADYLSHLSEKTTERSYREINQKKIAELDKEFFDELFEETVGNEIKEQFSFEERKSLMDEIKLGTRETPEGHGHCAKHVSFGPCVKKSCVGCKMLVTGPQKLPKWKQLYNEQQAYMEELEEEYKRNGVDDYKTHRMYQEQERLLLIYKDTINQVTNFAVRRGIPIEGNN